MHVYLINLKRILEPLDLDEIQDYKVDANYLMEDGIGHQFIDYVGDEYDQIDANSLADVYKNGVFELVQKDEKYNIHHIFKIQFGAFRNIAKCKLEQVKAFINSSAVHDFKEYYQLKNIVVNPNDIYIYNDGYVAPFDEWLMNQGKEGKKYQIIQVFDIHL